MRPYLTFSNRTRYNDKRSICIRNFIIKASEEEGYFKRVACTSHIIIQTLIKEYRISIMNIRAVLNNTPILLRNIYLSMYVDYSTDTYERVLHAIAFGLL